MKKSEYPKVIADMFGMETVAGLGGPWMSTEGTVMKEWIQLVGEALDVPIGGKVPTMRAMVESVGASWDKATMASEETPSGGGGNIRKAAFVALYEGLARQPAALRRRELAVTTPRPSKSTPDIGDDARTLRAVRVRRGQPAFRANLLAAYGNQCAVTRCDAIPALEAAHIAPYASAGSYSTANGLLLRADIHTLFDLLLITVSPESLEVILHPQLRGTTYETELSGRRLDPPKTPVDRPSPDALRDHRERSGL